MTGPEAPQSVEYVVIRPQIVGNPERGFSTAYYSDLVRKPTKRAGIAHGIRSEGHDDFLLAHLKGETLVMVSWQYEDRPDEDSERDEIAATFGWSVPVVNPPASSTPEEGCDG